MCRIQNRVTDVCLSAREANVFVGVGMFIMWLAARQMTVIMVLMHDHHGRCSIDHCPFFGTRFVNHPIIPTRANNDEIRNVRIAEFWKKEEIASSGTMELPLFSDNCLKLTLPPFSKLKRIRNIVIPTLTQQHEFVFQLQNLFRRFDKIGYEDYVRVDDAEQVA